MNNKNSDRLKRIRKFIIKTICLPIIPFEFGKKIRQLLIRGIFLDGVKTFVSLLHNKNKTKYYLTVDACCKDEGNFIQEWVEYYLLQGVEHFYLYNNNGTDNSEEILKPYIDKGIISWVNWPGQKQQVRIYEDIIKKHKTESRWMAVVDLDEFIVPLNSDTLAKKLKKYEKYNQIIINWTLYGSSGHKKKTEGLVIERFTKHARSLSRAPKAIVNPLAVVQIDIHKHIVLGKSLEVCRQLFQDFRINHYAIKSEEEYSLKKRRGDVIFDTNHYDDEFFKAHDINEVEDANLMQPYIEEIKKNIAKINRKLS